MRKTFSTIFFTVHRPLRATVPEETDGDTRLAAPDEVPVTRPVNTHHYDFRTPIRHNTTLYLCDTEIERKGQSPKVELSVLTITQSNPRSGP